MAEREVRCERCRFWERSLVPEKAGRGTCQRFPPALFWNPVTHALTSEWPETIGDDWCGEFRPAAAPINELLGRPVEALGLSAGTLRCVRQSSGVSPPVETVGELAGQTAAELLTRRGFGPGRLREVREALARHGLGLRGD